MRRKLLRSKNGATPICRRWLNVARTIGQLSRGHCLVIEKSTVPVQTGQQVESAQLQLYVRPRACSAI